MHASTETGRLLHADHHRTIDLVNRVEAFVAETSDEIVAAVAPAVRALLEDMHQFLAEELEPHFEFEEQAVFPIVRAGGAYALAAALVEEHAAIRPLARRVRAVCARALQEGFDPETWPVFRVFAKVLADRMVLHLQKEETTLLQAIDAALGADGDRRLAKVYRTISEDRRRPAINGMGAGA
jgi:hemerythrin-like domain-containing protein